MLTEAKIAETTFLLLIATLKNVTCVVREKNNLFTF